MKLLFRRDERSVEPEQGCSGDRSSAWIIPPPKRERERIIQLRDHPISAGRAEASEASGGMIVRMSDEPNNS